MPNMCGTQRFVTTVGRAFCLYVVLGSFVRRKLVLADVNAAIGGIRVAANPTHHQGG